jgi:hypothetical protein
MTTRQSNPASIAAGALVRLFEKLGVNSFQKAASITLTEHIANRSVALLSRDGGDGLFVGSGVCVRIGDHYLIATAKHNLQDRYSDREFEISDIEVCSRGEKFSEPLKVRSMGRSPSLDLAWLELDPEASSRPQLAFATLNEVSLFREDQSQHPCFLLGYPAAMAERPTDARQRPLLESACVGTMSITRSNRGSPGSPDSFAIEWPPYDGSLDDCLPEPYGVSGGGIWTLPRPDDYLVWSSERAKLVGIETLWRTEDKELVIIRIEQWLQLVADQIAELSDDIAFTVRKIRSQPS